MWSVSYLSKQIPELETEPIRIRFHLVAELATAIILSIAGIGMFTNQDWMMALRAGFPIWGIVGVLCVVWYYGYKFWVSRDADKSVEEPPAAAF